MKLKIKEKILLVFFTMLFFLIINALLSYSMGYLVSKETKRTSRINEISDSLYFLNQLGEEYLFSENKKNLEKTFYYIKKIKNDIEALESIDREKRTDSITRDIKDGINDYEILFTRLVSNVNKEYLVKNKTQNISKIILEAVNSSKVKILISNEDRLKLNKIFSLAEKQFDRSRDYSPDISYILHLTENLINRMQIITESSDSFEEKWSIYKISLLINEYKDLVFKFKEHREEYLIDYKTIIESSKMIQNLCSQYLKYAENDIYIKNKILLRLLSTSFILSITISSIVLYLLSKNILKPIKELVEFTKNISLGDYSKRINFKIKDEIGELGERFNHMVESLQESENRIFEYNKNLEETVNERTKELIESRKELENINKQLHKEKRILSNIAITDELTGLYNRNYLYQELEKEINYCKKNKKALSVIMIDIDYFKKINDTFGHVFGDTVLKKVSENIKTHLTSKDIACRYGGEEFIIILPEIDIESGLIIAEKIRKSIEKIKFDVEGLKTSISGGLAQYNGEAETEFIMKVDKLLYEAKRDGRNRIKI